MEVSVKGHNVDVGDALSSHIDERLQAAVSKYFDKALDATVTISRETTHGFHVEIMVHPLRAMVVQAGASGEDAYGAFDGSLERIAKQLRRYKRRLKDHRARASDDEFMFAQQYVLQPEHADEEVPEVGQPAIIAEMNTEISTLSVGEAVMRMDLAHAPTQMFRNSANGRLNVVYRRDDGNIGWIDPVDADAESAA